MHRISDPSEIAARIARRIERLEALGTPYARAVEFLADDEYAGARKQVKRLLKSQGYTGRRKPVASVGGGS